MKKKKWAGLLLSGIMAAVLSGCGVASKIEFSDAEAAKEALNTASTIYFSGDLEAVNQTTNILADEKVAGYMEESGFVNTKWTVTVDDQTWFYLKLVNDGPVTEDEEDIVKAGTFGYYDENDNCLGYAQERARKSEEGSAYYIYYLDADGNPKDYYTDEKGNYTYDSEGNLIATGKAEMESMLSGRYCYVQIDMEEGSDTQIDFMDKMAMYITLYDELYDLNKS